MSVSSYLDLSSDSTPQWIGLPYGAGQLYKNVLRPADPGTRYAQRTAADARGKAVFNVTTPPGVAIVYSLVVHRVADTWDTGYLSFGTFVGASEYSHGAGVLPVDSPTEAYGAGSHTYLPSEIPGLKLWVESGYDWADAHVYALWAVLEWLPHSGGFAFLLSGIMSLLGAGITLDMMPRIAATLRRRGHLIRPDSYVRAHRELRDYRRPHSVWMPGLAVAR